MGDPGVDGGERVGIEGDGSFGAEFAERDSQPDTGGSVVHDASEFEVEAFAEAQPGTSEQHDGGPGEGVVEFGDRGHDRSVDVGCERPG